MSLSAEDRTRIECILSGIKDLIGQVVEPVDPKVEGCFELAFSMLVEQIQCNRRYEWGNVPTRDDRFFYDKDNDSPSKDELNSWLNPEGNGE